METQSQKKFLRRGPILKAALIFVVSFAVFLALWLVVKGYYGTVITTVSSYAAAAVKDAKAVDVTRIDDVVQVGFIPDKFGVAQVYKTSIDIPIANYGFNVPLTLAIMAAFFPFLKSRRVYIEAIAILDFFPFLLTIFVGVPLVKSAAGSKPLSACLKLGFGLPIAFAPFISFSGDYYEMGSIIVTRIVSWITPGFDVSIWRSDDLFKLSGDLFFSGAAYTAGDIIGVAVSFLVGVVLIYVTYLLGSLFSGLIIKPKESK